jgi:hypothetical protein
MPVYSVCWVSQLFFLIRPCVGVLYTLPPFHGDRWVDTLTKTRHDHTTRQPTSRAKKKKSKRGKTKREDDAKNKREGETPSSRSRRAASPFRSDRDDRGRPGGRGGGGGGREVPDGRREVSAEPDGQPRPGPGAPHPRLRRRLGPRRRRRGRRQGGLLLRVRRSVLLQPRGAHPSPVLSPFHLNPLGFTFPHFNSAAV